MCSQDFFEAQRQRNAQWDKSSVGTASVMESIPSTPEVLTGACGDDTSNPFLRVTSQRKMSHDSGTFLEATSDCGDSDVIETTTPSTCGDDVTHAHCSDKESSTSSADTIVDQLPLTSVDDFPASTCSTFNAPSDVTPPADVAFPGLPSAGKDSPLVECFSPEVRQTVTSAIESSDVIDTTSESHDDAPAADVEPEAAMVTAL